MMNKVNITPALHQHEDTLLLQYNLTDFVLLLYNNTFNDSCHQSLHPHLSANHMPPPPSTSSSLIDHQLA